MSLSTALIPPQRQSCNRQTARIFAKIFEQRYGQWSYMKNRSISRNSKDVVQHKTNGGIVKCGNAVQMPRSPSFLPSLHRQKLMSLQPEDYRIYPQSIDLDAFFGEEQKCEKVSDVCLLNDHFMLVKMPNKQKEHSEENGVEPAPPDLIQSKFGSKLPRCFKCNRGSRVSPIREELEEEQRNSTPMSRPWTSSEDHEVEVFSSRTSIISTQNHRQLQAISVPAPRTVEQTVIVEQPQLQRKSSETSLQLQLETVQSPPDPLKTDDSYPESRGPLHWFLWPFRRRFGSRPKTQLAAVHKTYFVRWNKPPDTLWHGYGVERSESDKVGLRRCRSAIF